MPEAAGRITVDLGRRTYRVHVEPGCLARAGELALEVVRPSSAVVVGGVGLVGRYADAVAGSLSAAGVRITTLRLRSGERHKTLAAASRLYEGMLAHRLDRAGLVVAVGGGVIGDVAGFAAGTYMRGVSLMQVPTTLLAQADAGVGGKTGVNLPAGKNLVGVFHQPAAVLMDPTVLRTQRPRDFRSGLAEVIKHGIIRDAEFLRDLRGDMPRLLDRDVAALTVAVLRSCEIKASVVAADETETGLRAVLNFGHTVGHALEAVTGYRRVTHGEAVAIGMVSACLIGEELGMTPPNVTSLVVGALQDAGLPTEIPSGSDPVRLLAAMYADKKAVGGALRFVLVREVGDALPGIAVEPKTVLRALARNGR